MDSINTYYRKYREIINPRNKIENEETKHIIQSHL